MTNKFSSVRFSKAHNQINKWSVYLRPKSDSKGVHFHISYIDNGFICQDEIIPNHRQYYDDRKLVKLSLSKTPLGAINQVRNCLNNDCKIIKL